MGDRHRAESRSEIKNRSCAAGATLHGVGRIGDWRLPIRPASRRPGQAGRLCYPHAGLGSGRELSSSAGGEAEEGGGDYFIKVVVVEEAALIGGFEEVFGKFPGVAAEDEFEFGQVVAPAEAVEELGAGELGLVEGAPGIAGAQIEAAAAALAE